MMAETNTGEREAVRREKRAETQAAVIRAELGRLTGKMVRTADQIMAQVDALISEETEDGND